MASPALSLRADGFARSYRAVRDLSVALAVPLSDADASAQSMPDASPTKWHLAHTTWFFETFVLRDHLPGYRLFDERWPFLFNSYYEAEGARHPRPQRGLLTRPTLADVVAWRAHVDAALVAALDRLPADLVTLGLHHEQQHQELLLTDILHLFAQNPLAPAMWDAPRNAPSPVPGPITWVAGREGVVEIGSDGEGGFAFDCEGPSHRVLLRPHALAVRPVTNAEWRGFVEDGGYRDARLWLADGWDWVNREGIAAPLHWRTDGDTWLQFALDGLHPVRPGAPVAHVSFYEADAFARWAGARLPTEMEWEAAAQRVDPRSGNQLDVAGAVRPRAAQRAGDGLQQMFGDVWEWTASAFLPHPGFRPAEGAVGEYNGKFMSGQFVLKGASCATPRGHSRASYRNFFQPEKRWQFCGVRLAKDL